MSNRRGEIFPDENRQNEIDISHWFYGSNCTPGSRFGIRGTNCGYIESCDLSIELTEEVPFDLNLNQRLSDRKRRFTDLPIELSASSDFRNEFNSEVNGLLPSPTLSLLILSDGSKRELPQFTALTSRGGLIPIIRKMPRQGDDPHVIFIPTAGLETKELVRMIDEIALTNMESLVLEAMQTLDKRIERFAPKGGVRIMVRLTGKEKPMPIGILGDGVSRLLTIAVALAKSADGILLIDEIDTGLHHTTMDRMWKFVNEAAEMLNVQVFATTHSRDCFESLAVICQETSEAPNRVSIQRIDRDRDRAVGYSEAEIVAAARRGLEVR